MNKSDRRFLAKLRRIETCPRARYKQAKANAVRAGIAWKLTYEQWAAIWQASGRWGRKRFGYRMVPLVSVEGYRFDNVRIATVDAAASYAKWCEAYEHNNDWQHVNSVEEKE